jgi:predicted RNA polymerase sigma factor
MIGENHFRPLKMLKVHPSGTWRIGKLFLAHSARADMYRRLGRTAEARASYEKALARQEPERRFLARRLEELK